MTTFTITLPSGIDWTPKFVKDIDLESCIGCGRCFRVCVHNVLKLVGLDADGQFVGMDDDDDDDEYERKVMIAASQDNCIGCQACAQICPKSCYTHEAAQI